MPKRFHEVQAEPARKRPKDQPINPYQANLFGEVPDPPASVIAIPAAMPEPKTLPYAPGSDTSKAAAIAAQPSAGTVCKQVYELLRSRGPMTMHEIGEAIRRPTYSISARIDDLRRSGLVKDSGRRGKTPYGRPAALWDALPSEAV